MKTSRSFFTSLFFLFGFCSCIGLNTVRNIEILLQANPSSVNIRMDSQVSHPVADVIFLMEKKQNESKKDFDSTAPYTRALESAFYIQPLIIFPSFRLATRPLYMGIHNFRI